MADQVSVPQKDGEITITVGGDQATARTWRVKDGRVTPANEAERQLLLDNVDGAKPAPTT